MKKQMAKRMIKVALLMICSVSVAMILYLFSREETHLMGEEDREQSAQAEDSMFFYEGERYTYKITKDVQERFAFRCADGGSLEVMAGGGNVCVTDAATGQELRSQGVLRVEILEEQLVRVYYDMAENVTAYNQYRFHEDYVEVQTYLAGASNGGAYLERSFLTDYVSGERRSVTAWQYPGDGDFPYKTTEGQVTIYQFGGEYRLYSFLRGEKGKEKVLFESLGRDGIVWTADKATQLSAEYRLVFENSFEGRDADFYALFESDGSAFAANFVPRTKAEKGLTFFEDSDVAFDIRVANLTTEKLTAAVDYVIYDYYGNIVAKDLTYRSVKAGTECLVPIKLQEAEKGIYFVDYSVSCKEKQYRDFYTFAIVEDYAYKARQSSPFGLSGVRFGEYEPNGETVRILDRIGAANVRVCVSKPDYLGEDYTILREWFSVLNQYKIRINGQFLLLNNWSRPGENSREQYKAEMETALNQIGDFLQDFEVGNEYNLLDKTPDIEEKVARYKELYFLPGYEVAKQRFGLNIASAGVGHSQQQWMQAVLDSDLGQMQDILVTHAYGYPYAPDYTADVNSEYSVESALARTRNLLQQREDVIWYVNEIGYPTTPNNKAGMFSGNDLRSQADYIVRAMTLALGYGADLVEVYNLYDQLNLVKGTSDTDQEYHFGLFYYEDYYGRIMPKPSALAYMTMTRLLDGLKSCKEIETNSDTVRAFEIELQDSEEKVIVAWSTCYRLTNDLAMEFERTPNLPWKQQWQETETYLFEDNMAEVTVVDLLGNEKVKNNRVSGGIAVELSGSPCYIRYREKDNSD